MKPRIFAVAGFALLGAFSQVRAQQYTVTPLADGTTGMAINNAGQVSGSLGSASAFITNPATNAVITLSAPSQGRAQGYGLNASGQVVGAFLNSTAPSGHAFVTDPMTYAITDLNVTACDPSGLCELGSTALAVNDTGLVVGSVSFNESQVGSHAFPCIRSSAFEVLARVRKRVRSV